MDKITKIINFHNKFIASKKNHANQNLGNCQTLATARFTINA